MATKATSVIIYDATIMDGVEGDTQVYAHTGNGQALIIDSVNIPTFTESMYQYTYMLVLHFNQIFFTLPTCNAV